MPEKLQKIFLKLISNNSLLKIVVVFALYVSHTQVYANCTSPFLISFKNRTTTSITIDWRDNNPGNVTWEIELRSRNQNPTGTPTFTGIAQRSYDLMDLLPGTAYDVFLRTRCSATSTSTWNGPFQFTTVLTNPSPCAMNIPLRDDNCGQGFENYLIEVTSDGVLGQNIFLSSVDLIIDHDWPADLHLLLRSPSGKTVSLSRFNGTFTDHYGIVTEQCDKVTNFSSDACTSIREGSPPFLGTFRPEESLNNFLDGTSVKGIWTLLVCDNAINDRGTLRYIKLNFSNLVCLPLENFGISNVTATTATVSWVPKDYCRFLVIEYGPAGFTPGTGNTSTLNCNNATFVITGLDPEQEYDIYLITDCVGSRSAPTCSRNFTTKCATPTIMSTFDDGSICEVSCVLPCNIDNNIWYNVSEDDIDWIKFKGPSEKVNTGPNNDVTGPGNYLYTEHSAALCGNKVEAILQSKCMKISNTTGCDLSFYRHMYGTNIGKLSLQIKANEQAEWDEIWSISGESGNRWIKEIVDLSAYSGDLAIFRFVSDSDGMGDDSETALDQIEFFGSMSVDDGYTYYRDNDGDGYGVSDEFIVICSSIIPEGFALRGGDCDDNNPNINPGMTEILCNGIDDNCNGIEDDVDTQNPLIIQAIHTTPASCEGNSDGSISLTITGGTPPYRVIWNNGLEGISAQSFHKGFYYATISDANGCTTQAGAIEVKADNSLTIFVTEVVRATCPGIDDGRINIQHLGGTPPFEYLWSDGSESRNLENAASGSYTVTVIDSGGCRVSSSPITVSNIRQLSTGIGFQKPISCHGLNDGIVEIGISGGTAPYYFTWDDYPEDTRRREFLTAGKYNVQIKDALGCSVEYGFELTQPPALNAIVTNLDNLKCNGDRSGKIRTRTTGGTTPYSYLWSNEQKTSDLTNITAGFYTLSVTDNRGCKAIIKNIEVKEPEILAVRIDEIKATSCRERKDGSITITATGGTPEYFYSWRNGSAISSQLLNVGTGFYGITVFDQNGCKNTINNLFVDFTNESFPIAISRLVDNKCPGERNGEIAAVISSGMPPLDYNWSNGTQKLRSIYKDTIRVLPSGQYRVTITDAEGCVSISNNIELTAYETFRFRIEEIINNLCFFDLDGMIRLNVSGGTAPYDYFWSNGDRELIARQLATGNYQLSITDANGCQFTTDVLQILSPPALSADIEITDSSPNLTTGRVRIVPVGGIGPYRIAWDEFPQIQTFQLQNLAPGTYHFTISDAHQCEYQDSAVVKMLTSVSENTDIFSKTLRVYPNPASQILNIDIPYVFNINDIMVKIIDIQGKSFDVSIMITSPANNTMSIDISQLPTGIFHIIIKDGINYSTARFLKID